MGHRLQLGFDTKPERKVNKAERGHVEKAGGVDKARRFVRELRVSTDTAAKFEFGQEVKVEDLELSVGDLVDVTGRSKGRGFAGVMKRHNFAGFPQRTVPTNSSVTVVPSVVVSGLVASSKDVVWLVTWVISASPHRTLRSSRFDQKTT